MHPFQLSRKHNLSSVQNNKRKTSLIKSSSFTVHVWYQLCTVKKVTTSHLLSHEARFFSRKNQWSVYFGINYKHFACKRMINFFCDMVVLPCEVSANAAWRGLKRKLASLEKLWLEVMKKWMPRHRIIIALHCIRPCILHCWICIVCECEWIEIYLALQNQYYHWNEEIVVL